jgi:hypothetical protein
MISTIRSWLLAALQPFHFGADGLANSGLTGSWSKAGLDEGTNANTVKTAAPNGAGTDFSIDGIAYHKADTDNIAMNALPAQAADTQCLYLVQLDSGGALTIKKGDEKLTTEVAQGQRLQFPLPDDNKCPIGGFKIVTVAVTFTSGTTDLGAGGITDTFYDFIGGMPSTVPA